MLVLLIVCIVAAVILLLHWLAESSMFVWNCDCLSNKAVLITGCDFSEVAREIAMLLDKNGAPVFACCSDETNADRLKYV